MRVACKFLVLASASLSASCSPIFSSDVIRFEVRVDVPTASEIVSNSSVWEVKIAKNWFSAPASYSASLRGEGIVVALPRGGAVVGTLRAAGPNMSLEADQTIMLPENFFRDRAKRLLGGSGYSSRAEIISKISKGHGWSATTSYSGGLASGLPLPYLVYFPDVSMPTPVGNAVGNPALLIGDPQITITIVNNRVTRGIDDQLPWLRSIAKTRQKLDGKKYDVFKRSGLANRLGAGDFSSEI